MINAQGLRLNVGIILANQEGRVFWGQRVGNYAAWQFPQGGIKKQETPQQAMYRELEEELGLEPNHVSILGVAHQWYSYYLPKNLQRLSSKPKCIGQKQKWFLLRLTSDEEAICCHRTPSPEFDTWQWVDYWYPLQEVVAFKRSVYKSALEEFAPLLGRASK